MTVDSTSANSGETTRVPSVRFTTGAIRLPDARRHASLHVLGTPNTHESSRTLHRRLPGGDREGQVRDRTPGQSACRKLRRLSRAVFHQTGTGPAHWCAALEAVVPRERRRNKATTGYTGESSRHPRLPLNGAQSQRGRLAAGSTRPSGSQLIAINRLTV